jgi:FolB domain-containing protein
MHCHNIAGGASVGVPTQAGDTITLADLEVFYRVGVPDEERAKPQRLLLTVELNVDFAAAAATDDLAQSIDYYAVAQRLLHFGDGRSWRLIEKLASDLAQMALAEFKPAAVKVEVKKFVLPEARYVSVSVERSRQ